MTKTEKLTAKIADRAAFKAAWLAINPNGEVHFDGNEVFLRVDSTVSLPYNYLTYMAAHGISLKEIAARNGFTF